MKPNVLLWDERIDEGQFRTETVRNFTKIADCLLVVGSGIETEKAARIINSSLRKDIPVIEVNNTSVINKGSNIIVKGKPEVTLPELLKEYYILAGKNKPAP